jgi:D-3-phosphoglycerate dehydrogenase
MKILLADKLSPVTVTELEALGATVIQKPDLTASELPENIADVEVLVVRSTKVSAETIKNGTKLVLIIRAGAGVNTIDLDAASSRAIYVANCPGKNTDAVAELAIGLLIAADRRIVDASKALHNGKWMKKEYQKAYGLKGRTLGIIGLGAIGLGVARRAQGMDMRVIAWSRSLTDEKAATLGIERCETVFDVAEQADAVSLHVAMKPETKHLINSEFLGKMRDNAILVNCARGEVVDTAALKDAISKNGLRFATDVFENEPSGGVADFVDTEFAGLITCTPHIGASTDQASEATAAEVVRIVKLYKENGTPANTVNLRSKSTAEASLLVRHNNQVGVLAGVLNLLRGSDINIEEMDNSIFDNGNAATCNLKLDRCPSPELIDQIAKDDKIVSVSLI